MGPRNCYRRGAPCTISLGAVHRAPPTILGAYPLARCTVHHRNPGVPLPARCTVHRRRSRGPALWRGAPCTVGGLRTCPRRGPPCTTGDLESGSRRGAPCTIAVLGFRSQRGAPCTVDDLQVDAWRGAPFTISCLWACARSSRSVGETLPSVSTLPASTQPAGLASCRWYRLTARVSASGRGRRSTGHGSGSAPFPFMTRSPELRAGSAPPIAWTGASRPVSAATTAGWIRSPPVRRSDP